jgi:putative ABC transport system substrate-binding protein
MRKFLLRVALGILLFALCFSAEAQQPGEVPRIGFLQRRVAPTPTNPDPLWDAFLKGLRDLGYIDGKNIKIEHRYAEGRSDRLDALIAEFLQLKVDVIVVPGTPAIRAARKASKTIPIVIVTQSDPVAEKLVDSLARPGGNITGLTRLTSELSGKRLELFKEAVPAISRVAMLIGGSDLRGNIEDYGAAARALNLTLLPVNLTGSKPNLEGA